MTTKEIRALVLLNQTLEESIKNDLQSKIKKAKKVKKAWDFLKTF